MNVLKPNFIFSIGWIIVVILSYYFNKIIGNINILTNIVIFIGIFLFTSISLIVQKIKINSKKIKKYRFDKNQLLIYLNLNILIVLLLLRTLKKNFLINGYLLGALRYSINYNNFSFGLVGYLMVLMINFSIYLYVLYINNKIIISKKYMVLACVISLFYLICFTNRLNLIMYLINLFVIYCLKNKFKIKNFLLLLSFCFGIFYMIGKITKKMDSVKDVFISYFLLGYKHFDYILQSGYEITFGKYTFQIINKILSKIGLLERVTRKNIISAENGYYILTENLVTNVPTMYGRLISDFGLVYVYINIIVLAILTTILYKKSIKGSVLCIYIYSYVAGYLFFTFYDEMFFRILTYWIQIILSGYIFEIICREKKCKVKI